MNNNTSRKNWKTLLILGFGMSLSTNISAQSMGLNNATPDASSIIDMTATNRGMLVPRMTQANRNAITSPATSLLIFQTDATPGFYYNAGTPGTPNWVPFLSSTTGWALTGNASTTAGTNYLGTSDGIDLVLATAGTERLRVYNGNGLRIAPLSAASSTALDIGALSGATSNLAINIGAISGAGVAAGVTSGAISSTGATAYQLNLGAVTGANASSHGGIALGNISGATANAYGLNIGTITGGTTSNNGVNIGNMVSTGAANSYGINIGAISGTGVSTALNTGGITSTGSDAYQLNLGTISGANATSHTGINIGGISGATANSFGIAVGTITGGTAGNYGINVGAINSTGAANSLGLNIGAITGSGTNNFGINVNNLTSTGTSIGIRINGLSGAGTTNTGLYIAAVSGGTTNNFGLRITGTTNTSTNYGLYVDAPAQNYFAGRVGIGKTVPDGPLHIYEATGTTLGANNASMILEHGNNGGESSILFKSAVNAGSDYGYIRYSDDGSTANAGSTNENSLLTIGVENDLTDAYEDDIALMASGNVGVGTTGPNVKLDINGAIAWRPTSVSLTSDNQSVNVSNVSYLRVTSNSNSSNQRTISLTAGSQAGQTLYIISADSDANRQFELRSGVGNSLLNNTVSFNNYGDNCTLVWDGTYWILVSTATGY